MLTGPRRTHPTAVSNGAPRSNRVSRPPSRPAPSRPPPSFPAPAPPTGQGKIIRIYQECEGGIEKKHGEDLHLASQGWPSDDKQ